MAQLPVIQRQGAAPTAQGTAATGEQRYFGLVGQQLQQSGAQLDQLGDEVLQRHLQLQAQTDEAAGNGAGLQWRDQSQTLMSPVDGYLSVKGGKAVGIADQAKAGLTAAADKIAGTLQNDRQKQIFYRSIGAELDNNIGHVAEHEATQRDAFYAETNEAVVHSAIDDAVANAHDPNAQQLYMQKLHDQIFSNGAQQGLPPQAVEYQWNSSVSKVVSGTVEAMAYTNPSAAMKYLQGHRNDVLGPDRLHLEQAIDAGLTRQVTIANRQDALQAKATKDLNDATAKQGDLLLASPGGLPPDWLTRNAPNLSENDTRFFAEKMASPGAAEVKSDPTTVAGLWSDRSQGKDVSEPSRQAYLDKRISETDYKALNPLDAAQPQAVRDGLAQAREITAYSEINPDPAASAAFAHASTDFMEWWYDTGSKIPDAEKRHIAAMNMGAQIGDKYRVLGLKATRYGLYYPRTMEGGEGDDDETLARNYRAAMAKVAQGPGSMSPQQFDDEVGRLHAWREELIRAGQDVGQRQPGEQGYVDPAAATHAPPTTVTPPTAPRPTQQQTPTRRREVQLTPEGPVEATATTSPDAFGGVPRGRPRRRPPAEGQGGVQYLPTEGTGAEELPAPGGEE